MVLLVAAICLGNVALTLALARRVRELQRLVAEGGMRDPALPRTGDRVGAFTVTTVRGETVTEAALAGGPSLVAFLRPGCPTCAQVRAQLLERPPSLFMLAVVVSFEDAHDDAKARDIAASLDAIANVTLSRDDGPAVRAFREAGYPTLIRVEGGQVTAAGHRLADVLP